MWKVMSITGALAAAMLAVAPGARAQVTSGDSNPSPWATVRRDPAPGGSALADTAYINQTIRGNYTEVGLGRVAESRAADSGVKEFAQRMISEHNSMNQQWATLARNNRIRAEAPFGGDKDESIERLEDLSGAEFDRAYMAEMIRRHEQDLDAFEQMETSARSPEVRQLAKSGVSTIREHLALAQQVGRRVSVSTTVARTGGVTVPVPAPSDDARRRTAADGANRDERKDRGDRRTLRAEDRAFVEGVLGDHLMHIRLAKRAQREAKRGDTRRLAERIEKELTNWAERWENFADRRDANVTSHLERQHRKKLERLDKASERNFDHAYAAIVAEHLESLVDDFREERLEKRPGAVGRLAKEELPVLRDLLERARRLEKQTD